jgi:hypothetical protein
MNRNICTHPKQMASDIKYVPLAADAVQRATTQAKLHLIEETLVEAEHNCSIARATYEMAYSNLKRAQEFRCNLLIERQRLLSIVQQFRAKLRVPRPIVKKDQQWDVIHRIIKRVRFMIPNDPPTRDSEK